MTVSNAEGCERGDGDLPDLVVLLLRSALSALFRAFRARPNCALTLLRCTVLLAASASFTGGGENENFAPFVSGEERLRLLEGENASSARDRFIGALLMYAGKGGCGGMVV